MSLLNKLRDLKPILNEEYSVKEIGVFGSFANNEASDESDIDILVELHKPIGWDFFTLQMYLEGVFGRKVDLVTKNPQGCPINSRYFKSDAFIDFDESKEFYHPKYPSEFEGKGEYSDFRRTIFWKPDLIIDESGKARISFFNADQNARIKCVIEGFGENNLPVKKEFFYHVHD